MVFLFRVRIPVNYKIFKLFLLMMILIAVIILNRGGVLILCLPDVCQDFGNFFDSQVVSGYSGYTPSKKCLWKKKCLISCIKGMKLNILRMHKITRSDVGWTGF